MHFKHNWILNVMEESKFHSAQFWEERYQVESSSAPAAEWYMEFTLLKSSILPKLVFGAQILIPGCGTSSTSLSPPSSILISYLP